MDERGPSPSDAPANLLGRSLRQRRERASRALVGAPYSAPRRGGGLRRSEVAELAGISEGYYTRIEQGRSVPSTGVLEALINVLRFDPVERSLLLGALAEEMGRDQAHRSASAILAQERGPALAIDLAGRLVDANDLAQRLICDLRSVPTENQWLPELLDNPSLCPGLGGRLRDLADLLRYGAETFPGRRIDRFLGAMLRRVDGFGEAWLASSSDADDGWRAFTHPAAPDFRLRRAVRTTSSPPRCLVLAYEADGSDLAEHALARVSASDRA